MRCETMGLFRLSNRIELVGRMLVRDLHAAFILQPHLPEEVASKTSEVAAVWWL